MKYLYYIYQYLIAWPILLVLTIFTAVFTVCTVHWKNAEFVHKVQQFWSRSFFWLMFLPVSVYGWLPVIFKWLMKAELRKVPFVGTGCKAAGHIFVDRRNAKAAMESLKEVEKQLVNGVCTVIFPEGTRSLNGEVGRFKRGAFQIAWDLGLPVIPLSLDGCFEALPKGKPFVHRVPVHMHIGEPIDLKQFTDSNEAIEAVRNAVINGRMTK